MDAELISNLIKDIEDKNVAIKTMSDSIVAKVTKDLDELMIDINTNIISVEHAPDSIIEKYFLELTNAIYFINAKSEYFGFYEDIAKSSAKLAYNKAYSDNQSNSIGKEKKATMTDNQIYAENATVNEQVVNMVYSRSYKIIKTKIEAACEMVKTLSKILSFHMTEKSLDNSRTIKEYTKEER